MSTAYKIRRIIVIFLWKRIVWTGVTSLPSTATEPTTRWIFSVCSAVLIQRHSQAEQMMRYISDITPLYWNPTRTRNHATVLKPSTRHQATASSLSSGEPSSRMTSHAKPHDRAPQTKHVQDFFTWIVINNQTCVGYIACRCLYALF